MSMLFYRSKKPTKGRLSWTKKKKKNTPNNVSSRIPLHSNLSSGGIDLRNLYAGKKFFNAFRKIFFYTKDSFRFFFFLIFIFFLCFVAIGS